MAVNNKEDIWSYIIFLVYSQSNASKISPIRFVNKWRGYMLLCYVALLRHWLKEAIRKICRIIRMSVRLPRTGEGIFIKFDKGELY
jgi:hypothetical protein